MVVHLDLDIFINFKPHMQDVITKYKDLTLKT